MYEVRSPSELVSKHDTWREALLVYEAKDGQCSIFYDGELLQGPSYPGQAQLPALRRNVPPAMKRPAPPKDDPDLRDPFDVRRKDWREAWWPETD